MNDNHSIPRSLKDLFESGKADENAEVFVPPAYSLFFFGLLTVILLGLGGATASAIVARGSSLFQLEPGASLLGPIIAIFICLTLCVFGFWFFWQWINAFKRRQLDREIGYHSGIRLDRNALTVLYHTRMDREESFWVPKESIRNVALRTQVLFRNNRPGANGNIRKFHVDITDCNGGVTSIPARFFRPTEKQMKGAPEDLFDTQEKSALAIVALIKNWSLSDQTVGSESPKNVLAY